MNTAKEAAKVIVYKKIDARTDIADTTKDFLKDIANNFIDNAFDRLKSEYEKLSQDEIEKDLEVLATRNIENVYGSYNRKVDKK